MDSIVSNMQRKRRWEMPNPLTRARLSEIEAMCAEYAALKAQGVWHSSLSELQDKLGECAALLVARIREVEGEKKAYSNSLTRCQVDITKIAHENDRLLAGNAALREQLETIRQYSPVSSRACALCTYDRGIFVGACNYHQEIAALKADVERMQAQCDALTGMKFSDRMHAALKSRTESAEAKLHALATRVEQFAWGEGCGRCARESLIAILHDILPERFERKSLA